MFQGQREVVVIEAAGHIEQERRGDGRAVRRRLRQRHRPERPEREGARRQRRAVDGDGERAGDRPGYRPVGPMAAGGLAAQELKGRPRAVAGADRLRLPT